MKGWRDAARIVDRQGRAGGLVCEVRTSLSSFIVPSRHAFLAPPKIDFPREVEIVEVRRIAVRGRNSHDRYSTQEPGAGGEEARETFFVRLSEISTEDQAREAVGMHMIISVGQDGQAKVVHEDSDMSADDFTGWAFADITSGLHGVVLSCSPRHEQLLMEVGIYDGDTPGSGVDSSAAPQRRAFIPLVDEFVNEIDRDKKLLRLQCPGGLFDL